MVIDSPSYRGGSFGFLLFLLREARSKGISKVFLKIRTEGLPWWRSGWESACQCGGHGFEPWSGRIPHATEQLSP